MHRNFGVRRERRSAFVERVGMNGGGYFRDFWHDNDNHREESWPIYVIIGAVVLMIVVGIFA